jgi:hypothetical protein
MTVSKKVSKKIFMAVGYAGNLTCQFPLKGPGHHDLHLYTGKMI